MTTIDAIPAEGEPPPIHFTEKLRDMARLCLTGVRLVMDNPSPSQSEVALAEASRSRTQTMARSILKGKSSKN